VVRLPLGSDGRPARLLRREVGLARGLEDLITTPWNYDYAWPHFLLGLAAAVVVWYQRKRLPLA